MKTIGLLGGMSWESTLNYYKAINQGVKAALGGLNSAEILLYSINFDHIEKLQRAGEWQKMGDMLAKSAQDLEAAGAHCLLICTNTMHKVAHQIEENISIPLLHIADATAAQLIQDDISRVGLLGTAFTMEQGFYKNRLTEKFGIDVIVPNQEDRDCVHNVIYNELCLGEINLESKERYLSIINKLHRQGAQAIILGCTEIALLVSQNDTEIPLYDTTGIHADAAVKFALKK
ncbi:Aspartate racemase [Pseudoalteromonas sp. P1-9]|uniref:aspartate/glutamate racemase family protein n=1 Tax=Pseudoalteromonas sp. P1-9 TaxID=1710354 RepID=UPI0006D6261D|nr:aspartate/glutamate racemase family protein [Pseudoalteromonas sp. P1-9]KPV98266.1 Aspartate racemase [Pseudoalteromonas sp. P1-9]